MTPRIVREARQARAAARRHRDAVGRRAGERWTPALAARVPTGGAGASPARGPRGDGDARARRRVERGIRGAAAHLRPVEARRRAQLDGGWTLRARRHLERSGSSGDVAALQEGESPANGAGGGAAREPDGRRGRVWCGLRDVGGVRGGGDRRVSLKSSREACALVISVRIIE